MKALVIVAHPDDETLFLGGFIQKNKSWDWTVASVTQAEGSERGLELAAACMRLGARPLLLGLKDPGFDEPLDEERLSADVRRLEGQLFDLVITHNQVGEYGHPHHVSVSKIVRRTFVGTYQFGYNLPHDISIRLNAWELEQKRAIIRDVYRSQQGVRELKLLDLSSESLISPGYESAALNDARLRITT